MTRANRHPNRASKTKSNDRDLPHRRGDYGTAECEPHARSIGGDAAETTTDSQSTLDQRRSACDGCRRTVLESELEQLVLQDGTVLACCASCASEAPRADTDETTTTTTNTETDDCDTTQDAAQTHRCSQCTEQVGAELFRVTTVDDRSEQLCPTCKDRFAENGIIKHVEMRAARAREVLDVEQDATADDVRAA